MKRFYIIGFLILMSFDTLSQISFKYASTQALPLELSPDWLMRLFLNPWLYGAIAGYLGAFVTWMTCLLYTSAVRRLDHPQAELPSAAHPQDALFRQALPF